MTLSYVHMCQRMINVLILGEASECCVVSYHSITRDVQFPLNYHCLPQSSPPKPPSLRISAKLHILILGNDQHRLICKNVNGPDGPAIISRWSSKRKNPKNPKIPRTAALDPLDSPKPNRPSRQIASGNYPTKTRN